MQATNCPRCGRLFNKIRTPVCTACEKADEEAFEKLRAFIEENPLCTMTELTEGTHVSVKRITQFIRDGRLEISKGMMGEITCGKCGKPIFTGRYCDVCAVDINKNVSTLFGKGPGGSEVSGKGKMFTLGQSKKL